MWKTLKRITNIHISITFNEDVARKRRYPIVGKRNIFPLEGKYLNEKIVYSAEVIITNVFRNKKVKFALV